VCDDGLPLRILTGCPEFGPCAARGYGEGGAAPLRFQASGARVCPESQTLNPSAPEQLEGKDPRGGRWPWKRRLLSADIILEWNDSTLAHPPQNNPGNASRAPTIVQAAVFDAVNSTTAPAAPT
jgi:hypothetical protein